MEIYINVLQNLIELYNTLPPDSTCRVVAKGILENPNRPLDPSDQHDQFWFHI